MLLNVAIRVDASRKIGSGHVLRCLTLADLLVRRNARVLFVCRAHEGHLESVIRARGFDVVMLAGQSAAMHSAAAQTSDSEDLAHSAWLGAPVSEDAAQFGSALSGCHWDWIVVDHYALDRRWEARVRQLARHLMVIDDLADRDHDCDILLDQNLGRSDQDYHSRVGSSCRLLTGPAYALLRPEFSELRAGSLARRQKGAILRVLVSMGGVDLPNATGRVLDTLAREPRAADMQLLVVMGKNAPWLDHVHAQVAALPFPAEVRVNIADMARQMSDCDLAIGAAGGTAWERCCLGLPSVLVVLADNQRSGAQALQRAGAALVIDHVEDIPTALPGFLEILRHAKNVLQMQNVAARITDGKGAQRVIDAMEKIDVR